MKLLLTVCFAALAFASAQTCDIQTGLSCAKSVEPCIATCKTGALACAKCPASDWGACCPCIEKAIPKIPFKCPNATSRVQLEGTIAAPAHWAMPAEAPASTDLTSIYMFLCPCIEKYAYLRQQRQAKVSAMGEVEPVAFDADDSLTKLYKRGKGFYVMGNTELALRHFR